MTSAIFNAPPTRVRKMRCPRCDAGNGKPCVEDGQPRAANHAERVERYRRHKAHQAGMSTPVQITREEREAYRQQIRQVPCPHCGAGVNERCRSRRPQGRLSNHQERVEAWRAQRG